MNKPNSQSHTSMRTNNFQSNPNQLWAWIAPIWRSDSIVIPQKMFWRCHRKLAKFRTTLTSRFMVRRLLFSLIKILKPIELLMTRVLQTMPQRLFYHKIKWKKLIRRRQIKRRCLKLSTKPRSNQTVLMISILKPKFKMSSMRLSGPSTVSMSIWFKNRLSRQFLRAKNLSWRRKMWNNCRKKYKKVSIKI